jgi:hypothetical protein
MKKLTIKEVFFVLTIYAFGIVYILTDQLFVPIKTRLITLILVQVIMYVTIYTKIKSNTPLQLSLNFALMLCIFVIPLYVIKDIIINKNYTFMPLILTLVSLLFPFIFGLIYQIKEVIRGRKS